MVRHPAGSTEPTLADSDPWARRQRVQFAPMTPMGPLLRHKEPFLQLNRAWRRAGGPAARKPEEACGGQGDECGPSRQAHSASQAPGGVRIGSKHLLPKAKQPRSRLPAPPSVARAGPRTDLSRCTGRSRRHITRHGTALPQWDQCSEPSPSQCPSPTSTADFRPNESRERHEGFPRREAPNAGAGRPDVPLDDEVTRPGRSPTPKVRRPLRRHTPTQDVSRHYLEIKAEPQRQVQPGEVQLDRRLVTGRHTAILGWRVIIHIDRRVRE